mgnify:CR=1 FL=1
MRRDVAFATQAGRRSPGDQSESADPDAWARAAVAVADVTARRLLARRSVELLATYRRGEPATDACPLRNARVPTADDLRR